MSNDNNELKNNAPCEEKQETRELSMEELEKVNGGHALASGHDINIMVFDTDVYDSGRT